MEFINKRFSNWLVILLSAIVIIAALYLFFYVLPLIILGIFCFWAFNKGKRYFKNFSIREKIFKRRFTKSNWESKKNKESNFNDGVNEKIIDVEYSEV